MTKYSDQSGFSRDCILHTQRDGSQDSRSKDLAYHTGGSSRNRPTFSFILSVVSPSPLLLSNTWRSSLWESRQCLYMTANGVAASHFSSTLFIYSPTALFTSATFPRRTDKKLMISTSGSLGTETRASRNSIRENGSSS